jgi:hypothetical protein
MEKNRLNALSAMEIKNVYHVMELELTHAQIVRATEIVQNVMMDGTPAMSVMEKERWIVQIATVLATTLIRHVISVEEVVTVIITITKFVEHVVVPADLLEPVNVAMAMALLTAIVVMATEDGIVKSVMELANARIAMVKVVLLVKHVAEVALVENVKVEEKFGVLIVMVKANALNAKVRKLLLALAVMVWANTNHIQNTHYVIMKQNVSYVLFL